MKDLDSLHPTINSVVEETKVTDGSYYIPARYLISIMTSLGLMMTYLQRVVLSQTIVSMVNRTAIPQDNSSKIISCEVSNETTSQILSQGGSLVWDEYTQGLVLSSFFWGYVITQLPGGWLTARVGGKWPMGFALLFGALLTLLSPITAEYDYRLFIALRILLGLCNGVIYPSATALLSNWVPPGEKNLLINIAFIGATVGTALNFPMSGLINKYLGGWQAVFYSFGILCILWFIFWSFLVFESPDYHPRISTQEKIYIEESMGKLKPRIYASVPWRSILTSRPMWALSMTAFLLSWNFYVMLTELPTYISNILLFPITENSLLMTLPYFANCVVNLLTSYFGDRIIRKGSISLSVIRKGSTSAVIFISSGSLLAVTFAGCDRIIVLTFLILSIAISGIAAVGIEVNYADIAPKYSGVAYSVMNTFSNTAGIIAPYVVGVLTQGKETIAQWNKVFYILIGMNFLALIIFTLFASVEPQPWNDEGEEDDEKIPVTSTLDTPSLNPT